MPEPGKTLIILTPAFAESEQDSWLPAQEALVRSLNACFPGLNINILTFHFPAEGPRTYTWYGNRVMALQGGMKGRGHTPMLWHKAWKQLKVLCRGADVLGIFSFFCSECAFIGHYFARRYRLEHRIWILGQDAKKNNRQVRRIRPAPGELIAISDFLVQTFEQSHGIRPAYMIPTGISTDDFPPPAPGTDIDILAAGSLIPLKQYHIFIEVIGILSTSFPDLKAVLCGEGPEMPRLVAQVKAAGLERHVRFAGKLARPALLALMQRSKVFLHPSAYEGLSGVCAEALYAGADVISFCKPMNDDMEGWQIATGQADMAAKAALLLRQETAERNRTLVFSVGDAARQIMATFGYPSSK